MYYHVRITTKSNPAHPEVELDIGSDDLRNRFVIPYSEGRPIFISGKTVPSKDVDRILINETCQDSTSLNSIIKQRQRALRSIMPVDHRGRLPFHILADQGENVTARYITGPPGHEAQEYERPVNELVPPTDARDVFVVHGRNLAARDALFEFLRSLNLHPLEWSVAVSATGKPSPYIGEILDAVFSRAHAVVVLFTPDDEARLKRELKKDSDPPQETELIGQARPNVLFEAGMAMGRSAARTVLVEIGILRPFSDIAGLHVVRMDDSSERRQELAQRLRAAGCPVNLDGTDWHSTGDFDSVLTDIQGASLNTQGAAESTLPAADQQVISQDARQLLLEVVADAESGTGVIMKTNSLAGTSIRTNGKNFGEARNRRSVARWESAIVELVDLNYLEDPTGKGSFFQPTHKGFEAAENLGST